MFDYLYFYFWLRELLSILLRILDVVITIYTMHHLGTGGVIHGIYRYLENQRLSPEISKLCLVDHTSNNMFNSILLSLYIF